MAAAGVGSPVHLEDVALGLEQGDQLRLRHQWNSAVHSAVVDPKAGRAKPLQTYNVTSVLPPRPAPPRPPPPADARRVDSQGCVGAFVRPFEKPTPTSQRTLICSGAHLRRRQSRALFLLGYYHPLRKLCARIAESKLFDAFILVIIIMNCVTLAIASPATLENSPKTVQFLDDVEVAYIVIFTFEAVVKILAWGMYWCGPKSYLRDTWNKLDFFIVIMGYVEVIAAASGSDAANVKPLRAFRVLRPLKLVTSLTSLQVVLGSIINAIPALTHVGLLLLFLLVIYAIIGLEFYMGVLNYACHGLQQDPVSGLDLWVEDEGLDGQRCNPNATTPNEGFMCPMPLQCMPTAGPNNGVTTFDNAGLGILTVFQCITLEGWTDVLYAMNDANGANSWNAIYFTSLIILGSFFLMNLVLGVLSGQFTNEGTRIRRVQEALRRHRKLKKRTGLRHYHEWLALGRAFDPLTLEGELPEDMMKYSRRDFVNQVQRGEYDRTGLDVLVLNSMDANAIGNQAKVEEDRTLDDMQLMLFVRLPDSSVEEVCVEPSDTLKSVESMVYHRHPSLQDTKLVMLVSKTNKPILSKAKRVGELEPDLRLMTARERDQIDVMDEVNRAQLFKGSTLQLLSRTAAVLKSAYFSYSVSFLVLLNTITLAIQGDFTSERAQEVFGWIEVGFVCVFVLEVALKMWAFGVSEYFRSKFNRLDFLVVIASAVELILVETVGIRSVGISVLRCIRLLRWFRYTRYWEDMNDFATALLNSTSNILSLLLLLFIFVLIAALLGMQAFGGRFDGPLGPPRTNFDNFYQSALAVFQILTGEDWNAVMYEGIEAYGGINSNGFISVLYCCAVVILGNFVLLNVFLAIAVNSISDAKMMKAERHSFQPMVRSEQGLSADEREERRVQRTYANPIIHEELDPETPEDVQQEKSQWLMQPINDYKPFFVLAPTNRFRVFVHGVAFDRRFDTLILLAILISSVLLAVEDPVNENALINQRLRYADIVFTALFTLEMVMKWIAMGVFPYVKDPWNDLDLLVVTSSIVSLALEGSSLGVVRVIRVLRVLRPLRTIKRTPGLRHVVVCMVQSVKIIGNVFLISFLLIFIFSVIGTQQWSYKFDSCNDLAILTVEGCAGTFTMDGETLERRWEGPTFTFDTVPKALNALFAVSTLEGWVDIMHGAVDAVGVGEAPVENYNGGAAMFFVVYIVLIAFFMLNVFVGYVILTFSEEGESRYEGISLDKNQRECLEFALKAKPAKDFAAEYKMQKRVHWLVSSLPFEYFIMFVIMANSVFLLMAYDTMGEKYVQILTVGNYIFTSIFTLESILKLFAFNPSGYFIDSWNSFDFVIVIGSLVDIGLAGNGVSIGFLRLFRAMRLLKLVSRGKNMKRLLWTFLQSFKSLPFVALLIGMVFFVYAIVGMIVFARVQQSDDRAINRHNNFASFGNALLLLFRASTGENWQAMMVDCMLTPPEQCSSSPADGGTSTCGSVFAIPFFITFVILCTFLVLNLFIAVIMDNFEYLTKDESELGPHHLSRFVEVCILSSSLSSNCGRSRLLFCSPRHRDSPH